MVLLLYPLPHHVSGFGYKDDGQWWTRPDPQRDPGPQGTRISTLLSVQSSTPRVPRVLWGPKDVTVPVLHRGRMIDWGSKGSIVIDDRHHYWCRL